ncbi:hypothetical protein M407DRAFT_245580 [Tulasnella calospora MUT 4182]|uniref:Uncharacterized protein n=1 Tax=Tulasnella calospora MUT 4182 TaxID=1051891 RepID=A0A0C3PZV3_9AGAM|nr:hypothetical protein M407DRAFT_245580 [Tulasnella calospora MUT 4182]
MRDVRLLSLSVVGAFAALGAEEVLGDSERGGGAAVADEDASAGVSLVVVAAGARAR